MNIKFHKTCENRGKIQQIVKIRCNFVKFVIYILELSWAPMRFSLVLLQMNSYIYIP